MSDIRLALYSSYGEKQISTIYTPVNTYQVILEAAEDSRQFESGLNNIYVRGRATDRLVPLASIASVKRITRGLAEAENELAGFVRSGNRVVVVWRRFAAPTPPVGQVSNLSKTRSRHASCAVVRHDGTRSVPTTYSRNARPRPDQYTLRRPILPQLYPAGGHG